MKMLFLFIFGLLLTVANGQAVCDSVGPNCNVVTDIDFANLQSKQFTYPDIGDTIVGGTTYEAVISWDPEAGHSLIHSFEIYKLNNALAFDCSKVKLWNNGVTAGATAYTRGPLNDQDYCIFDITETFPREDLLVPSEVYFLFEAGFTDANAVLFIDRKNDYQVVALEDTVYYRFQLESTTLSTDSGTHALITLDVENITYTDTDFDPFDVSCNTMETLLANLAVGSCSLPLQTVDNVNGLYTFHLLKTQYDFCADSVTQEGDDIVYNYDIVLPTDVGSCYYFKENDSVQEINVQIDVSNIVGDTNVTDIAEVSLQVVDYGLARCDPESSIIPHHKAVFGVNYTFAGDTMIVDPTSSRYLDTPSNVLTVLNTSCTLHPSGDGNECLIYFESSECRPMYVTEDNDCVTDRFNDNVLNNMDIKVTTSGAGEQLHNFTVVNTALEDTVFDITECTVPADINAVNVTDVYSPSLLLRNLPTPDWGPLGSGDLFVKFYEALILELTLNVDSLGTSQLQIQTVTVTVRDPSDDSDLAVQTFTKSTKEALHEFDWTGYYTDAHFCTYHNNDNTCEPWYDPASDRDNAYFQANLAGDLADICQTPSANKQDYFSFHPDNWFTDFQIPEVDVNIRVVATIELCDGSGRRLLRELQENTDITTIEYISLEVDLPVSTIQLSITAAPTTPTAAPTVKPAEKETDLALILGVTGGGMVLSVFVVWWLIGGRRHHCTYDRV